MSTHNEKAIQDPFQAPLSCDIKNAYNKLIIRIDIIPAKARLVKKLNSNGVSVADIVAYQIGWGKLLIGWYEAGLQSLIPQMPGEGFDKWDYNEIAQHFYQKYHFDGFTEQDSVFKQVVTEILHITEKEFHTGNLDKESVWDWCTLKSGKKWPLSKWIRVNTSSPYKRAYMTLSEFKFD